jgi:uncharacterized protein YyaL (SSP411 family)
MFLSPHDHRPFFGGTYFPVEARHGMPAFRDVLQRVAEYYRQHGQDIQRQGDALIQVFGELLPQPAGSDRPLSREPLATARAALQRDFDGRFGGFGDAPKFTPDEPQVPAAAVASHGDTPAGPTGADMATLTLRGGRGGPTSWADYRAPVDRTG